MTKYTTEFKLSVVEYFLSGKGGQKVTAKKFGTDHSAVRKWVAAYRLHGIDGLKSKQRRAFSAEYKESVITYMRQHNLSARATAAHFNISIPPIHQWARLYDESGIESLRRRKPERLSVPKPLKVNTNKHTPSTKNLSSDELLAELEYLRAENACLKKLQALIQEKNKSAVKKKQRS